jgi:hypothetical protein
MCAVGLVGGEENIDSNHSNISPIRDSLVTMDVVDVVARAPVMFSFPDSSQPISIAYFVYCIVYFLFWVCIVVGVGVYTFPILLKKIRKALAGSGSGSGSSSSTSGGSIVEKDEGDERQADRPLPLLK